MKTLKDCKVGDTVYVLSEYNLEKATFLKLNKKSVKVRRPVRTLFVKSSETYDELVKIEKVAYAEEKIAVVWETWKGVNGRGGYRLEKTLYPERRMEASKWPRQGWIWENEYGVSDFDNLKGSKESSGS